MKIFRLKGRRTGATKALLFVMFFMILCRTPPPAQGNHDSQIFFYIGIAEVGYDLSVERKGDGYFGNLSNRGSTELKEYSPSAFFTLKGFPVIKIADSHQIRLGLTGGYEPLFSNFQLQQAFNTGSATGRFLWAAPTMFYFWDGIGETVKTFSAGFGMGTGYLSLTGSNVGFGLLSILLDDYEDFDILSDPSNTRIEVIFAEIKYKNHFFNAFKIVDLETEDSRFVYHLVQGDFIVGYYF